MQRQRHHDVSDVGERLDDDDRRTHAAGVGGFFGLYSAYFDVMTLDSINLYLGLGTIVLEIVTIALLVLFFLRTRADFSDNMFF